MADLNMGSAMNLSGQVALVTGGGTGIGLMIAQGLASNGAKVYITGRREIVLKEAADALKAGPGILVPLVLDVMSQASIDRAVQLVKETDGKLDVLVNNAGNGAPSIGDPEIFAKLQATYASGGDPYSHETFDGWTEMFSINTSAPFFMVNSFKDLLTKGASDRGSTSSVINISSVASEIRSWVYLTSFAYNISKCALEKMSVALATDFAHRKIPIRVNVIRPGVFPSPMHNQQELHSMVLPGYVAPTPAGRGGTPRDMAMTATYLATSDYTTGAILSVDGGLALVNP